KGNQFKGKVAIGRLVFDVQGIVTADPPSETDPPQPDYRLDIVGAEPPQPDADPPTETPAARILMRGSIRFADPPDPDAGPPGEFVADYLIIFADGSMAWGSVKLAEIGAR